MEHKRSAVLSYDKDVAALLTQTLVQGGYEHPECSSELGVAKLGTYDPSVFMVDFDHIRSDQLESVRQVRFVLPDCSIVVVSSDLRRTWARQCHLAGATCVLPGGQSASRLLSGLKRGVNSGCFTDPAFGAGRNASDGT